MVADQELLQAVYCGKCGEGVAFDSAEEAFICGWTCPYCGADNEYPPEEDV